MKKTVVLFTLALMLPMVAPAAPLNIVNVAFPDVNCKFDTDCTIYVNDLAAHFSIGPTTGDAFLQSRSWPAGESGTSGAGLHPYLYRIDLRELVGLTAIPCAYQMQIDFGPVSQLDYDGDSTPDDVFVGTAGGLGTVAPSSADLTAGLLTFQFSPPICAGSSPGAGDSSFFFGRASAKAPVATSATLSETLGSSVTLEARAPAMGGTFAWRPDFVVYAVILIALVAGYLLGRRRKS